MGSKLKTISLVGMLASATICVPLISRATEMQTATEVTSNTNQENLLDSSLSDTLGTSSTSAESTIEEVVQNTDSSFYDSATVNSKETDSTTETADSEKATNEKETRLTGEWGTCPYELDTKTNTIRIGAGEAPEGDRKGKHTFPYYKGAQIGTPLNIIFEGEVVLQPYSGFFFASLSGGANATAPDAIKSIQGLEKLNTSQVTDMSNMFKGYFVKSIDISGWDTHNVVTMEKMFGGNKTVESIYMRNLDLSSLKNTVRMFVDPKADGFTNYGALKTVDFTGSKMTNLEQTDSMFEECVFLENIENSSALGSTNLKSASNMFKNVARSVNKTGGFFYTVGLEELDLSDVKGVPDNVEGMFNGTKVNELDISGLDLTDAKKNGMLSTYFNNSSGTTQLPALRSLTLGEKTIISGSDLINLTKSGIYTQNWINIDDDDVRFSSSQLFMGAYDGGKPGTYVQEYINQQKLTVEYKDTKGVEIHPPKKEVGTAGLDYDVTTSKYLLDIPGYTLVEDDFPDNAIGTFTTGNITVTYIYKDNSAPEEGTVTVSYKDEDGVKIAEDTILSGAIGEPYQASPQEIEGYTFSKVEGEETGTYTEENQTITYTYAGTVLFKEVPTVISFGEHPLSKNDENYAVASHEGNLEVQSLKKLGSTYEIAVQLKQPFVGERQGGSLADALNYIDSTGMTQTISDKESTVIFSDKTEDHEIQSISDTWGAESGFQLHVNSGAALKDSYTAVLEWTIFDNVTND
ncbi:MucBP domain-containing protein [Enterococcus faecalis]|uniref:MucBP domain-containing protein n=1 Tax=Enterococcus faecalis TaxID=1351 RepID=UPI00200BD72A|nr:MucBP domain-containing protein [Enterococcus faecalis]MCU2256644.1 MucBP domain-containing protein [Enterococcus faecalis]UQF26362.1 MucBP domain-containing protein [Enterococcus faecalis]UQF57311.1 MucBP domain-containing protein [Enterococcus faecalis]UQR18733.1 MucBP domain-containing protein [Enterococcus faecalis]WCG40760.1 MucBP domain-containing protein [Enterococcus faecalis]